MKKGYAWLGGFAELRNLTWVDLPTSHWPMWSRPQELATVIAKVALTNGRISFLRDEGRRRGTARAARTASAARTLFRLRDFMFRRGDFALHLTELHPFGNAARFVEEINDPAGQTAHNHD